MRNSISSISSDTMIHANQSFESESSENGHVESKINSNTNSPVTNNGLPESNGEASTANENIPSSRKPAGAARNLNPRNRWSSFIPGQTLRRSFYALSAEEELLQNKLQALARSQNAKLFEDSIMLNYDLPPSPHGYATSSSSLSSPSLSLSDDMGSELRSHLPNTDGNQGGGGSTVRRKPYNFGDRKPGDGLRRSNSTIETKSSSLSSTNHPSVGCTFPPPFLGGGHFYPDPPILVKKKTTTGAASKYLNEKPRRVVSMTAQSLIVSPSPTDDNKDGQCHKFMDFRDLEPIDTQKTKPKNTGDGGLNGSVKQANPKALTLKGQKLSWTMTGDLLKDLAMSQSEPDKDDRISLVDAVNAVSDLLLSSPEINGKNTITTDPKRSKPDWTQKVQNLLPPRVLIDNIRQNLPLYGHAFGRLFGDLILECKNIFIYRSLALFSCAIVLGQVTILVVVALTLALSDFIVSWVTGLRAKKDNKCRCSPEIKSEDDLKKHTRSNDADEGSDSKVEGRSTSVHLQARNSPN